MSFTPEQESIIQGMILKCRATVNTEIRDSLVEIQHVAEEVDTLKQNHIDLSNTLVKHEKQRKDFNTNIENKIDGLKLWFKEHDSSDSVKYETIIESLSALNKTVTALTEQTTNHSNYISEKAHKDSIETEVQKRMTDLKGTGGSDSVWKRVRNTAISLATVAVLGATGTGIMFIYDLYQKLGGGN